MQGRGGKGTSSARRTGGGAREQDKRSVLEERGRRVRAKQAKQARAK
jgi:hypothetical protein